MASAVIGLAFTMCASALRPGRLPSASTSLRVALMHPRASTPQMGGLAETAAPSWRLSRKLIRNTRTGRVEEFVELEPSSADYEVSESTLVLPTKPTLGVELVEVGGEFLIDGEGTKLARAIVLVSSLVQGGNAWQRVGDPAAVARLGSIEPGDTIVAVGSGLGDVINTEAAGYDATVRAIQSVASAHAEISMVVKRLVRRKVARVTAVLPGGEERTVLAYDGETLRMALIRQGVGAINDDSAQRYDGKGSGNCGGNGLCCTCVVSVLDGAEHLNERTTSEKQLLRKVARWRQSCRARVRIGSAAAADSISVRLQLAPRSPTPQEPGR